MQSHILTPEAMKTTVNSATTCSSSAMRPFCSLLYLLFTGMLFISPAQSSVETYYLGCVAVETPAANAMLPVGCLRLAFKNDFCLKELMYKEFGFVWTRHRNSCHLHLSHFGFSKFGRLSLQAGYARMFGPRLSIGMSLWYLLQHAGGYAAIHSLSIDLSALFFITQKFGLSVFMFNPVAFKYGITGKCIIPMRFRIEVFHKLHPRLIISGLTEKDFPGGLEMGTALYYQPVGILFLHGICTQRKCGLGILCRWRRMSAGVRVLADYRLGLSIQCELNCFFNHEKTHTVAVIPPRSDVASSAAGFRHRH